MDNQPTLDQHHAIFLATLDYIIETASARVIVDQHDDTLEHYEKLRKKAEKHYRAGNLQLLQRVIREIGGMAPIFRCDEFLAYMKERTGYEAELVNQTLPAGESKYKRAQIIINDPSFSDKKLAELDSPDNKRKIIVRETSRSPDYLRTTVDLQFGRSGSSVYMVNGADLDINVYWKDNNTVIIETRAEYVAVSRHGERYQCMDNVVMVEYWYVDPN